jgi:hypothetical protein
MKVDTPLVGVRMGWRECGWIGGYVPSKILCNNEYISRNRRGAHTDRFRRISGYD